MKIPFNKPYITGKETVYIKEAISTGHLSGNGKFTKMCQHFFEHRYGFKRTFLTSSCTDALEMCALLLDIKPGDEVIVPSYTFVSSALAFVRQGAKIIFVDSRPDHPGMDENKVEEVISLKTKVIVTVHYAGVACDMDKIMDIATRHHLYVVEDAAHALNSFYTHQNGKKSPLGSIGHLAAFSFHETKNVHCGEGGLLVINDDCFVKRAEIIWEKGTNRAEYFRGDVNKYSWMDNGSSFLPSEITAAFLWAQLEEFDRIQEQRCEIWECYFNGLKQHCKNLDAVLPVVPDFAFNNAHLFYLVCRSSEVRNNLLTRLKKNDILAVFHYLSLHNSPYYRDKHDGRVLHQSDRYSDCLLRLPFYIGLNTQLVIEALIRK